MTVTTVEFNLLDADHPFAPQRYRIGLVVRGMTAPGRSPGITQGHADCVLSTGAPVGFFGDTGSVDGSYRDSVRSSGSTDVGLCVADTGYSTASIGGGSGGVFSGVVYSYADYLRMSPGYVDRAVAAAQRACSTLLTVDATAIEARRFDDAWASMRRDPGQFGLIGWNCSTHAGWAFACAGLLASPAHSFGPMSTSEVGGFDTPTHLFQQLFEGPANPRIETYTGYLGFEPLEHGRYRVLIESV